MSNYIVNNETDGDRWYHVHVRGSNCAPKANYKILSASTLNGAIAEAKRELGKKNVKACSKCN